MLPLISCALNMRTSILYEFDGFLSSPKRVHNKRNKISINWQKPSAASSSFADPEGGRGFGPPWKITKIYNKITATIPAFNVGPSFKWRFAGGPLMAH